jgi:hypothetical protein
MFYHPGVLDFCNVRLRIPLLIMAMSGLFLVPAVLNGFPFVFADTGTYLSFGIQQIIPWDRPVYYGLFSFLLNWKISPWPVIVAQSAIMSALIWITAKSIFSVERPGVVLLIAILLSVGSSLPWFVGQIMPDIFTSALFLAILIIYFGWHQLESIERWFVVLLVPATIGFHYANLLIALSMLPAIPIVFLLGWRPERNARRQFLVLMASFLLGIGALITNNAIKNRGPIGSPSASTFLLAKLLDDGPALWILEKQCPERPYLLCTQLSRLQSHRDSFSPHYDNSLWNYFLWRGPLTDFRGEKNYEYSLGGYFLWFGPLDDLGGYKSVEQEARQINIAALRTYPYEEFRASVRNALRQFFRVAIGDGLGAYSEDVPPSHTIRELYGETVYRSYRASSQMLGNLVFTLPNLLQLTLLAGSGISLIGIILWYRKFDKLILYVVVFAAIFLVGNAAVTGIFSDVRDRYQSRVVWLLPFVAALSIIRIKRQHAD